MKKRFLRLLAIACTAAMLSGMMTGCRKETPSANNTTENTEADSEIDSTQQNTEDNATDTSTEATEHTENNVTEGTEGSTTEASTDATEHTEATEAETTTDIHSALATTLDEIQNIRAGSAGSSLRAEEAFSSFTTFVNTYGADNTSETICQMTTEWLDKQKEDNPYIYEEFAENFYSIPSLAEDSSLAGSDAYKHVLDGIQNALQ